MASMVTDFCATVFSNYTNYPYAETAAKVLVPAVLVCGGQITSTALAILGTLGLEFLAASFSTYAVVGVGLVGTAIFTPAGVIGAGGYLATRVVQILSDSTAQGILRPLAFAVGSLVLIVLGNALSDEEFEL